MKQNGKLAVELGELEQQLAAARAVLVGYRQDHDFCTPGLVNGGQCMCDRCEDAEIALNTLPPAAPPSSTDDPDIAEALHKMTTGEIGFEPVEEAERRALAIERERLREAVVQAAVEWNKTYSLVGYDEEDCAMARIDLAEAVDALALAQADGKATNET